ncbi:hypothetical protein CKA55_06325 [Arcobacter suis]|uniref:Uncharacterized protein n=1 Tax=Arcobacter suis CECT 7833 TaxID=663365 RepID=A0AAD0WQQ3_9BACT|nr:hypothetical protein [Arcobacter suis]AXX89517.1 hypothetical protein ASUIS_1029 [Arcobacter suis CECT 7833]RWS46619.1 hypothetical protein CKA55_06325 [Arcobacter suis]
MYLHTDNKIKSSFVIRREELSRLGFEKLSNNVYQKDNLTIILKSMVHTTNIYEINSVSIKENIYQKIKNTNIVLEVFERNCYRSKDFLEIYEIPVFQLIPTNTYRNKKTKTMRYKVQNLLEVGLVLECMVSVNNIILNELVS